MTERDPRYHLADLQGTLKATSAVLVILAWVLGASFIGAEWHNRTITTLLTWEPRRIRVMLAKALACVLVAFCGALALQALLAGALTPAGVLRGTTEGMNAAWIRTTLGVGLRIAATSAIASVIGLSIAAVGRSAAAAMGTGFAYLVLFENLIGSLLPRWRPWLLISNAVVFVNGSDTFGIAGRGAVRAGVLLSAYAAGALVVATVLFLRRDVG